MSEIRWQRVQSGEYRCGEHTLDREWRRNGGQRWVLRGPTVTNHFRQQFFPTIKRATAWLERKLSEVK